MRIGIYSPYLDTLSGGEWYMLSLSSWLSQAHTVLLYWDNPDIVHQAQERFQLNLQSVSLRPDIWRKGNLFSKYAESSSLDMLFFLSDGSIPLSFSKRTILLFQFPIPWVQGQTPINKLKLARVHAIVCNSEFTKKFVDQSLGRRSLVIPPGIDIRRFHISEKKKCIISVGRFTKSMNTKRQDVLIDAFITAYNRGLDDWNLVLAGSLFERDKDYLLKLKSMSKGFPITFEPNIATDKLQALYASASIYWHAAGFGQNLEAYPQKAEHFGITTVEAMASGVVPMVFEAGGQTEIVNEGTNGLFWHTQEELVEKILSLANDKKLLVTLSKQAAHKAKTFDINKFYDRFNTLIKQL